MSKKIEIVWTSDEQLTVPNYGVTVKGRKMLLPADIAESFIERNMAKKAKALKEVEK